MPFVLVTALLLAAPAQEPSWAPVLGKSMPYMACTHDKAFELARSEETEAAIADRVMLACTPVLDAWFAAQPAPPSAEAAARDRDTNEAMRTALLGKMRALVPLFVAKARGTDTPAQPESRPPA